MASNPDRDTSGLSGWLYTDLLLGLTVVFLGTVSFIIPSQAEPIEEENGVPATTTTTIPTKVETIFYTNSKVGVYDVFDVSKLETDIADFISSERLTGNPKVALAFVKGRYQSGEAEGIGSQRASTAYDRLKAELPSIFTEDVLFRPIGNRNLTSNSQFGVELFFTYERAVEVQRD
jgi:hypothetical protein